VYWVPVFEVIENRGNRRQRARRESRSGTQDGRQQCPVAPAPACGLLRASFRPGRDIAALRVYLRRRERLLDYAANHIQHMQKALTFLNLQWPHVVSDVTGVTGLKIIRAIVNGQREPRVLAPMRDVRGKARIETVCAALVGNSQPEPVFALGPALELYDVYPARVDDCAAKIEEVLAVLAAKKSPPSAPMPTPRHRTAAGHAVNFDVRPVLSQLAGVGLAQIHGLGPYLALRLIGECGTDLSRWKTAKHFTSWLTLSPGSKISGGKVLSAHTRKTTHRVVAHLRLAALTVGRTTLRWGRFAVACRHDRQG